MTETNHRSEDDPEHCIECEKILHDNEGPERCWTCMEEYFQTPEFHDFDPSDRR